MKGIEMLATFNSEGNIQPFRFRLTTEDESLIVVSIDNILFSEADRKGETIKYRCECSIQDRKRNIDIFFYKHTLKWYLKL